MIRLIVLVSVIFYSACINPSNTNSTGQFARQIKQSLSLGSFKVDVYDSIKRTPTQKVVLSKFESSIHKNLEQLSSYLETAQETGRLTYSPLLGLTKSEFNTLVSIQGSIQLIRTRSNSIKVIESFKKLSFKLGSPGKIDSLIVHYKDSTARFNNFIMKYVDTITLDETQSGLGEKVSGSFFSYEGPQGILGLFKFVREENYNLIIGKLSNGSPVIIFKGKEVEEGKTIKEFCSAYYFREMISQ